MADETTAIRASRVPDDETAEDRFQRLAVARTRKVLHDLKLIGNLSTGQYGKTDEQVARMFGAIEQAVADARQKYNGKSEAEDFTF